MNLNQLPSRVHLCLGVAGVSSLAGLSIGLALFFSGCLQQAYYVTVVSGLILLVVVVSASVSVRCLLTRSNRALRCTAARDPESDLPPPYKKSWAKDYSQRLKDNSSIAPESNNSSEKHVFTICKPTFAGETTPRGSRVAEHDCESLDEDLPKYEDAINQLKAASLAQVHSTAEKSASSINNGAGGSSKADGISVARPSDLTSKLRINASDEATLTQQSIILEKKNARKSDKRSMKYLANVFLH